MATINTNAPGASNSASLVGLTDTPKQIQDRFLTLLVAQLQNQDPLSPMDNAQITQQMSQISTVQGIAQLNDSISQLVASQATQAANLIGRSVLMSGNGLELDSSGAVGAFRLAGDATEVKVDVLNSAGDVVDTVALGPKDKGLVPFSWDGNNTNGVRQPDASYSYRVRASVGSAEIGAETFTSGRVTSVSLTSSGPKLVLGNGDQVATTAIREIL